MADKRKIDATERRRAAEQAERERREMERLAIEQREQFYGLQFQPEIEYYEETSKRKPGDTNWVGYGFDIHPYVTFISGGLVILFLAGTLMFQAQAEPFFNNMLTWVGDTFGWLYILAANFFLIFIALLAFSKYGAVRIGGDDAQAEFSTMAWYAMLLSAGMGIGLMFWGVGEPMFHYGTPSPMFGIEANTPAAAQAAMGVTYFHWGLHAWGVYALVGLSLAFFAYNRGLPLTIRSVFYPLLKEKIYGFWGNLIDVLSVIATLFGLATSLGFGVQQVSAGLNHLFGLPTETWFQVVLIAIITGMATLSVVAGLDGGVKRLSEWNMGLAALLLLFVLILGPTVYILGVFTQSVGFYLQNLPLLSSWVETFHGTGEDGTKWQNDWTIFYWGWWIAWSPFVGMFIARVSKGRTVREFVVGVTVVPSLLSFMWMAVFGGSALWLQLNGTADIATAVSDDVAVALFIMLENFPLAAITSFVGIILVTVFFVTSSDSGSLVVDHLTSGGKLDSPVPQRVFWAVTEGACASILLIGGGLTALQSATIATGLPFALVLMVMCYSLYRGLREELGHKELLERRQIAQEKRASGALPAPSAARALRD